MTKFLLAVHVLAAIIAIGPVTVAASMFPPAARRAMSAPDDPQALTVVRTLNRICQVYAFIGLSVPAFGLATASSMGIMGEAWLIVSMALTALAGLVLAALVLPRQSRILASLGGGSEAVESPGERVTRQLAMHTGIFNLLWAVVTVLMIVRPGSTTNA